MLTLNAADLMPIETPWQGTPHSPGILFETRQRKLIPFSPFDSSLNDANMLIMSSSGGGKTFMAQMFLLMLGRLNPLISIIERGDSYAALTELMGGRVIEVDLEGTETLNPWDLPPGQATPSKDKIAFLKNLTRHMIGDGPTTDSGSSRYGLERRDHARLPASGKPADEPDSDIFGPPGRVGELEKRRPASGRDLGTQHR